MQRATVVAVYGDTMRALPHHTSLAARDVRLGWHVTRRETFLDELHGHVEVLLRELLDWLWPHGDAFRIVQIRPSVFSAGDEIGQQHPGDGAVRHPLAAVAAD